MFPIFRPLLENLVPELAKTLLLVSFAIKFIDPLLYPHKI